MPEGMIRRGKAYDEWCALNSTKEEVKPDKWLQAHQMAEALKLNVHCNNILAANGKTEEAFHWEEEGVKCKGKVDRYLTDLNVIVDYKTVNDFKAKKDKLPYEIVDMGYLLQLAHYQAGVKAILGLDSYPGIMIMAQKTSAPYVCRVYSFSARFLDNAHAERREILVSYKECSETGIWTDIGDQIIEITGDR
jgi:hypothetical protein